MWFLVGLLAALALGTSGAQAVTIESLQGTSVDVTALYDAHIVLEGREMNAQTRWHMRMRIESGGSLNGSFERTAIYQGRDVGALGRAFSGKIGTPADRGDGHLLWLLSGNKLILLRTFEVGGVKAEISLSADGRSCSARAPLVREVGAGNTRMKSAARQGAKVEVLSSQQVSSNCTLSR
jgi:hypothetical protein